MALSHKDRELPNSRIWLAEIDIESVLEIPNMREENRKYSQRTQKRPNGCHLN